MAWLIISILGEEDQVWALRRGWQRYFGVKSFDFIVDSAQAESAYSIWRQKPLRLWLSPSSGFQLARNRGREQDPCRSKARRIQSI